MIKLGIIGAFWLTDEFIKAVKMSDGICYYAQYSRNIDRAREYGRKNGACVFYDDLESMAGDPNIDAVYIASPNMLHYSQSKLFLMSKKHVICEKPICVTVDEYEELCALARENGVIYMEAMLNIHIGWAHKLKARLTELGRVVSARFDFNQRSSKLDRVRKGEMFSSFDKNSCGGALMDLGVYCTSLATFLFGMPVSVYAKGHFSDNGADLSDTLVLEYEGFECVCTVSKINESIARSEIICENGVVSLGNLSQLQNTRIIASGNTEILHGNNTFHYSMIYEINSFLSYIDGDICGYEKNVALTGMSVRLIEALRAKTGYDIKSVNI